MLSSASSNVGVLGPVGLEQYRAFQNAFREASRSYREGTNDVPFPRGAFRPTLCERADTG